MEKIYEEKSSSQSRSKINLSIVLSFVVAVFAIMSLIVVGFNQISYAAPSEVSAESVPKPTVAKYSATGTGKQIWLTATGSWKEEGVVKTGHFQIPVLYDGNQTNENFENYYLFCIQQGTDVDETKAGNYSAIDPFGDENSLSDAGVAYILSKSALLGGPGIAVSKSKISEGNNKYIEYFATQITLWLYLNDNENIPEAYRGALNTAQEDLGVPRTYTPMDVIRGKKDANGDYKGGITHLKVKLGDSNEPTIYDIEGEGNNDQYFLDHFGIEYLVFGAEYPPIRSIDAHFNSTEISLVENDTEYQTDKISVEYDDDVKLNSYYVDIVKGIKDAYVVDSDGKKRNEFGDAEVFYIRVPVDKVTEENKTVTIKVSGDFEGFNGGSYYGVTASQAVTRITTQQFRIDNEKSINFLVTEDTGMTTAQTVYFIGLIVLLCGVGIIYANAKPVEEK